MKKFLNKKSLVIVLMVIILIFLESLFDINKEKIKEINGKRYSLAYDNTWKIKKKDELEIELMHKKSKSNLKIKIIELDENLQYKSTEEIFDSLLYNIKKQNNNYKLLSKDNAKISSQKIDGYRLLFESNEEQVAIYTYKQGDEYITITYQANYKYFDILIDSVNSIINSFSLNEPNFDIKTSIDIETKKIEYSEQSDIEEMLNNTEEHEIANANYMIKYSIPSNFKDTSYNSKYGYYAFENLSYSNKINLSTCILNLNIYEYLDKKAVTNIYKKNYLNTSHPENERLDKFGGNSRSYIYNNKYISNDKKCESIIIVYELNKNHIFVLDISSEGIGIPKKLIDMIKINEVKNIAGNIKNEKENGFLIGHLKHFTDYSYKTTEEVVVRIPETYQEIDKDRNIFENRNYISEYNEFLPVPKYEIEYSIQSGTIESNLKIIENSINKNLGEFTDFIQSEDIIINNKKFNVYNRRYTRLSETNDSTGKRFLYNTNEKVLFFELQNNKKLVIIIKANEGQVEDQLLNIVTNFDINVK